MKADASGATLERLYFPDGSVLIAKHLNPSRDWMMRATDDPGRAALLWTTGTMSSLPREIDPALVRIESSDDGWVLYMRDVHRLFAPSGTRFSGSDARRVLAALSELHAAFWTSQVTELCSIEALLALCSPRSAQLHAERAPFLQHVLRGWELFAEIVPTDVAAAVFAVLEDPGPFAERLRRDGVTLTHADPHFGNMALTPDRLVLLDWSLAAHAPPALDFAWFLDQSGRFIDTSCEELIRMFLELEAERVTSDALQLALLAEVALAGWQCVDRLGTNPDGARFSAVRSQYEWWVAHARRALEIWSP